MIRVDKGQEPPFLGSELVDLAIEKMEEFYNSKNRNQKRYDFPFNKEIDKEIKKHLHEVFYGKCGYCEIKIDNPDVGTVDRFRPNTGVREKDNYFQDLYWWLTFEWNNLVYCCKECNQYKANYFPLKGKRATSKSKSILVERKLLLNPCEDDVENHLGHDKGYLISQTDEGFQTIELINLNRTSLVNLRLKAASEITIIVDKILDDISTVSPLEIDYINSVFSKEPKIEFLFIKHKQLLEEIESYPILLNFIDAEENDHENYLKQRTIGKPGKRTRVKIIKSDYFPIESLEIKNFKSIKNLKIEFPIDDLDENAWLTLLGENGLGKSSILQAFCIGLAPHLKNGNKDISNFIMTDEPDAEITIKQRDSDNLISTRLIREGNLIEHFGTFESPLIGYGSTRLLPNDRLVEVNNSGQINFQNLFDPFVPLSNVIKRLLSLFKENKKLFDIIAIALKELLPKEVDDDLIFVDDELRFKKTRVPYHNLSDGYKSTISLALDIIFKLSDGKTDINKLSGIVIIDELGNQLHPRWQMRVVQQLRRVFPKITFIVSTHHPLCLRGLKAGEIIVLNKNGEDLFAVHELPDPAAMRVDQILASEFFGLNSLIDPELEAQFNRYYDLLSRQSSLQEEEKKELNLLKEDLREKKHLGASLREELMYSVIDNLLAQKVLFSDEPIRREKLKTEAIIRVREIWDRLNIKTNDQS